VDGTSEEGQRKELTAEILVTVCGELTGLSGSGLERRDPRCLEVLSAAASTLHGQQIQANISTTAASFSSQRSRSLIVIYHPRLSLTCCPYHYHRRLHSWLLEQSATSPPTARDTCLLRFELVGNLPLRNAAPLGHAHLQVRPLITGHTTGTGRSRGRPAIFIPSALCRLTCRDGVRLVSAARHSASVLLRIGDGSVLAFCIIINLHSPRNGSNTENTAK